jgi:hypothetical protein
MVRAPTAAQEIVMFHTPYNKVPVEQSQAGQIVNDPRPVAPAYEPRYIGRKVVEVARSANSEYRNDRRAYP